MLQMSMFAGNLFVYFQFQGKTHIDEATRQLVFSVLITVAVLGVIFLATLKNHRHFESTVVVNDSDSNEGQGETLLENVVQEFKSAVKLFTTRDMLLLSVTFLYTGE